MKAWRRALGPTVVLVGLLLSACCPVLTPAPSAFVAEIVVGPGGELRGVDADGHSVVLDFADVDAADLGTVAAAGKRVYLSGRWAPDGSLTVATMQLVPAARR